jgi:prepilin-type N-terminal cleavage/methylation domain-containing protein
LRGESGFTLIEVVTAMVIFAGLAAAMAGLLTSAISANKLSRQRTIADQAALEQLEYVRRLAYDDVGVVAGNPPGVIVATKTVTLTGFDATVTTQVRYVDDPTPTSYETTANYKRVTVTVRRTIDNQLLAQEVTLVAPTSRTPFGGVNLAIVEPLVIDYGLNVPVEGATVNLLTGPSAPRSDVTDETGAVSFKKLDPNATANCPSDCYDLTAALTGYVQLDSPTRLNVGPGQTATPTIQIYRPSTIHVVLRDSGGGSYAGDASVKITSGRDGKTQTFSVTGGSAAFAAVSGEQIVPNVQYTVEAWTTGGTPLCAAPSTQYVPDDYPTDLSSTFTLTFGNCPSGDIAVNVTWGGSTPASGAVVTLSGGPYGLSPVAGTTDSSGNVTFLNVPDGSGYTVVASKAGQSATDSSVSVTTGSTTNVALTLPAGSLVVQVRWAGTAVNGATVVVTGGPDSVNLTQTTPSSGNVTFADLPPGNGYTVQATMSGQTVTLTNVTVSAGGTTVTANLPTGTVVVNVKRSGTNQSSATVRLTLGPMGINVSATTNSSGNATFTNVPVGAGYTISAWKCSVSNPKSGQLTSRTVNTGTNNFAISFSTNTCPLP